MCCLLGSWFPEELPELGEPVLAAGLSIPSRLEPPGWHSPPGMGPAPGRREPAAAGGWRQCLQRSAFGLGTSPASHLGLSPRGAGSGPGNSLLPAGADCLGDPKRGEWIWRWQPQRGADLTHLAASVPTRRPSRLLPGAAEGPRDGRVPSLLRNVLGAMPTGRQWDRAGDEVAILCLVLLARARAQVGAAGMVPPGAASLPDTGAVADGGTVQQLAGHTGTALGSQAKWGPPGSPQHSPSAWRGPLPALLRRALLPLSPPFSIT